MVGGFPRGKEKKTRRSLRKSEKDRIVVLTTNELGHPIIWVKPHH